MNNIKEISPMYVLNVEPNVITSHDNIQDSIPEVSSLVIYGIKDNYNQCIEPPNIQYSINNIDAVDNEIEVEETIDNDIVWKGTIRINSNRVFNINKFDELEATEHTVTIKAKDKRGRSIIKSTKFTKIVTSAPEIILNKIDYGIQYNDFNVSFKVMDKDMGDSLIIKYYIDNDIIDTRDDVSREANLEYCVKFSDKISDGKHILKIVVTDMQQHTISKTVNFTKLTKYNYEKYSIKKGNKGDYIATIIANNGEYPDNGQKNGFWYIKTNKYISNNTDVIDAKNLPVITGQTPDLGDKLNEFSIPYTINDADKIDETLSVQEIIDDNTIKSHNIKNGSTNNMTITDEIFKELQLGSHMCSIVVTDKQNHVVTKKYVFNKILDLRIECKETSLGEKDDTGFDLPYEIKGSDGNSYTIKESIDNMLINQTTHKGDGSFVFHVTPDIIKKLKIDKSYNLNISVTANTIKTSKKCSFTIKYNVITIKNLREDYGSYLDDFNISYKVSNTCYDSVNCFEYIDDNQVWAGILANDVTRKFQLNFDNVDIGKHTIKIVAVDSAGKKVQRLSSFIKMDKTGLDNNRFGIIPLDESKRDIAVPHELMMSSSTGHVYIKNTLGKTISKTEELEKLIIWCINSLYTNNSEGTRVSKITEIQQLIDSIIPTIYTKDKDSVTKITKIKEKVESIQNKISKRVNIGKSEPSTDTILWIDTNDYVIKTYINGKWEILYAGWI